MVRSEEWTGSAEGARVDIAGDPNLPNGQRTFYRWFNTAAFAMPKKGTFGNAGVNVMRNPGINNWDLSITKKFPLHSEQRWLQFRTELFNAWNHTQWNAFANSPTFDPNTGKITNLSTLATNGATPNGGRFGFGALSGVRTPRNIQIAAKFNF